ncbi:peroxisome proliferator-activated receptor gamma coactivator-related protein 1 isoform X2 [Stegastes partitus]|uniref:Peroxisome proliferator-activated receptor gamma coactivator-related protein 1 isoform X2 n=1 Tax=Stegastes partitus TaxID=144197 RepID=A0A9Y4JKY7_9TELE|nr:PREDICTED: peroxisome proliferator-activated receptor gamma coactivator-related protein 1-like isoform X2 [Stegastes partitus]
MAARWRGEDGALNPGGGAFLTGNTPAELVLCGGDVDGVDMDTQSCVDHSILAIFEDSTAASEGKIGAEESATLLSALTEMLDSVEDDDHTLSPFDTLPDTKLLNHTELRDTSVELSLAHRLRPRLKPPHVTFTVKSDREKDQESKEEKNNLSQIFKKQNQMLFQPKTKKAEAEVEVFTATSLINLVRIMHPYCLKLHMEEEGDKVSKNSTTFSQEEVWKYERPTEESDEEINVVSDDEAPAKDTKDEDKADGKRDKGLKSALLNRNSPRAPTSRDKKRVSFGPVQVASFDDSVEETLNERNVTSGNTSETEPLNSTKALESPVGSALEQRTVFSEVSCTKTEVQKPKRETKAKSLSLQQYRQLRQKRLPLLEKQGTYTTKWPSVSEPPKELTPILCLQGQKHSSCRSKTTHHHPETHKPDHKTSPHRFSEAKLSTRSGLKRLRTKSKVVSPASPLPDVAANPNVIVPKSKKSPAKKPLLLSSDPPNPVLLPLPVPQMASPSVACSKVEFSSRESSLKEIQNESSAAALQRQTFFSEPKPQMSLLNTDNAALLQEIQTKFTKNSPDVLSTSPAQTEKLQPQKRLTKEANPPPKIPPSASPDSVKPGKGLSSWPPPPVDHPTSVQEEQPDVPHRVCPPEEAASAQTSCIVQRATVDSGIEAPDLTSLLEQFEETQAKDEIICEPKPGVLDPDRTHPTASDKNSRLKPSVEPTQSLSASVTPVPQNSLRNLPDLQTLDRVVIPEPLCPEIILSSQQDQPTRRKTPLSKTIQIIDPRPLPPRRTHTEPPAAHTSPHMYLHISSDHDYCGSLDHPHGSASQHSRVRDVSTTATELQVVIQDSAAASEGKKLISAGLTKSEQTRTRSEPSTDEDLQFSDENENKKPQCTLPTPPPSPLVRGRERTRYRRRSPRSDSSSSSRSSSSSSSSSSGSQSSKRRRLHHKHSESSSCSSSLSYSRSLPRRYRLSYSSRSRSRSWSRSRSPSQSRSPSPRVCRRHWRDVCNQESRRLRREHEIRIQKLKAIDERRVVYVGRIRKSMTHDELRERFSQFGVVECVSLHFRDRGDHYGFVTFYNMEDAFAAIDNGGKLRKPDELPFDICFGGRRQFCNSDYADLDANRDTAPSPSKSRYEDLDFDSLLKQAQRGIKR